MAFFDRNIEEEFEATALEILKEQGVTITIGRDFEVFRQIVEESRPDHTVADPFDDRIEDLSKYHAVWIVGRDLSGRVVHTHAMRLLPMEDLDLAQYMRLNFKDFLPERHTIDFDKTSYRPGPGAKRMRGRVAYAGEFWLAPELGKYRGTGVSNVLGRLSFLVAMQEFAPDHMFGFMIKPVAYKGFVLRLGYLHAEPNAIRWCSKNSDSVNEGIMTYMSMEDMKFSLDLPWHEVRQIPAAA